MQNPTVGRIVHYYLDLKESTELLAAIVTRCWGGDRVRLQVFGHSQFAVDNAGGSDVPKSECWCWPPSIGVIAAIGGASAGSPVGGSPVSLPPATPQSPSVSPDPSTSLV